jgi:hypothetical protein
MHLRSGLHWLLFGGCHFVWTVLELCGTLTILVGSWISTADLQAENEMFEKLGDWVSAFYTLVFLATQLRLAFVGALALPH